MPELTKYVSARGIDVITKSLPPETPAKFDGPSITLSAREPEESRAYYLAHSFGSIIERSLAPADVSAMFEELRRAKATRDDDRARFVTALNAFRAFEERSSGHATWALRTIGFASAIARFTLFFRADLEAITIFHCRDRAPVWRRYLAYWKAEVESGRRILMPFEMLAAPAFTPLRFELQEVHQQHERVVAEAPAASAIPATASDSIPTDFRF